jgi:DNA-binding MarR family transcriptional regulator
MTDSAHLTHKQILLMTVIAKGNGVEGPCDLDEILDRVPYETSKQSLQFSIRALIRRGLIYKRGIEKRRGRQRVVIDATAAGRALIGIARVEKPHYVVALEDDELDQVVSDIPEDL